MRAVLDPNVLISALLSSEGASARALLGWVRGDFELVVSPLLLEELERALGYPKLRRRIPSADPAAVLDWLSRAATRAPDPPGPARVRSPDPGDDYVIALAEAERAALVSGDRHLLGLARDIPVLSPAAFLSVVEGERGPKGA